MVTLFRNPSSFSREYTLWQPYTMAAGTAKVAHMMVSHSIAKKYLKFRHPTQLLMNVQ